MCRMPISRFWVLAAVVGIVVAGGNTGGVVGSKSSLAASEGEASGAPDSYTLIYIFATTYFTTN